MSKCSCTWVSAYARECVRGFASDCQSQNERVNEKVREWISQWTSKSVHWWVTNRLFAWVRVSSWSSAVAWLWLFYKYDVTLIKVFTNKQWNFISHDHPWEMGTDIIITNTSELPFERRWKSVEGYRVIFSSDQKPYHFVSSHSLGWSDIVTSLVALLYLHIQK